MGSPAPGQPFWLLGWAATVSHAGHGVYLGAPRLLAAGVTPDPAAISFTTVMSRDGRLLLGLLFGGRLDR